MLSGRADSQPLGEESLIAGETVGMVRRGGRKGTCGLCWGEWGERELVHEGVNMGQGFVYYNISML